MLDRPVIRITFPAPETPINWRKLTQAPCRASLLPNFHSSTLFIVVMMVVKVKRRHIPGATTDLSESPRHGLGIELLDALSVDVLEGCRIVA
jgi:hypothetical protein